MLKACYCHSLVNCCLVVIAAAAVAVAAVVDVVAVMVGSMETVDRQDLYVMVLNVFDAAEANVIAAMAVVNCFGGVMVVLAVELVDPLESAVTSTTVAESWLEEPLWHYLAVGFSAHCLTAVETTFFEL